MLEHKPPLLKPPTLNAIWQLCERAHRSPQDPASAKNLRCGFVLLSMAAAVQLEVISARLDLLLKVVSTPPHQAESIWVAVCTCLHFKALLWLETRLLARQSLKAVPPARAHVSHTGSCAHRRVQAGTIPHHPQDGFQQKAQPFRGDMESAPDVVVGVQIAFGRHQRDALVVRHACIALQRMAQMQTRPSPNRLQAAAAGLVLVLVGSPLEEDGWYSAAEAALKGIYALHPAPEAVATAVLRRLATAAFGTGDLPRQSSPKDRAVILHQAYGHCSAKFSAPFPGSQEMRKADLRVLKVQGVACRCRQRRLQQRLCRRAVPLLLCAGSDGVAAAGARRADFQRSPQATPGS